MGFNSTLVVLNDHLHLIGKDQSFGEQVERAVLKLSVSNEPVWLPSGCAVAIEQHHADGYIPVLVGHNTGKALDFSVPCHTEDMEMDLLRRLAEKKGFNLHRKRPRR